MTCMSIAYPTYNLMHENLYFLKLDQIFVRKYGYCYVIYEAFQYGLFVATSQKGH